MKLTTFIYTIGFCIFLISCESLNELSCSFNAPAKKRNVRLDKRYPNEFRLDSDSASKIRLYSNRQRNVITVFADGEENIVFSGKVSRYKNMYFLSQPMPGDTTWMIYGLVIKKNTLYGINTITDQPGWIDSAVYEGKFNKMILGYDSVNQTYRLRPDMAMLRDFYYPRLVTATPQKIMK
ncbi:MAG TPA: hypothetical protein VK177_05545 [Flavobacteriales bacterium]|nr:hypothetical protein [Flavobacteriales bacterium]